jgi:threonine dehydrogenase-like Zn-dependent dehydrogenase
VKTVQLTMNVEIDVKALQKYGPIDAFQDWSPPEAGASTHIKSCIESLRVGGRASLMGGISGDVSLNYAVIMFRNLQIRGKFMYAKQDVSSLIRMVLTGLLKLDKEKVVETFPLERWSDAFKAAEESTALGKQILLVP